MESSTHPPTVPREDHPSELPRGINLDGLPPWGGMTGADWQAPDVVVAGIPYDGSAVYRRGAARAPSRIRRLSAALPAVTETGRFLAALRVSDLGDLDVGDEIELGWEEVAGRLRGAPPKAVLTVLGGDHCSAIPVVAAQAVRHPDLALLWVDAHPDLCDQSRGGRWTCGCALRRALEVSGLSPSSVVIAGARDYDQEEVEFITANGIRLFGVREVAADPVGTGRAIARAIGPRPLHVSFDIDVLDPACAPGTELPVAGGLTTRQALDLLGGVAERARLVGFDIMEVCPPQDLNDITTMAALKLIFEFWSMAWNPVPAQP